MPPNTSSTNSQGTALITGASSGIGAIYADRLARRGHHLADDTGRTVSTIVADLNNQTHLAEVARLLRTDDSITVLVNSDVEGTDVHVQVALPGATRTSMWEKAGTDIATLPESIVMDANQTVDAALAGPDLLKAVNLSSLSDIAGWEAFEEGRRKLTPHLSFSVPAARHRASAAAT